MSTKNTYEADGGRSLTRRVKRVGGLTLVLVAVAAGLSACGGGSPGAASSSSTTAAAASSGGSSSGGSSSSAGGTSQELEFAQCMGKHGVNIPAAPGSGSSTGGGSPTFLGNNFTPNSPAVQAAEKACAKYAGAQGVAPGVQAQVLKDQLKYAQCMRSHGVSEFPDPGSNGGFTIPKSVNQSSSTFQAAESACNSVLPAGPGNGGS